MKRGDETLAKTLTLGRRLETGRRHLLACVVLGSAANGDRRTQARMLSDADREKFGIPDGAMALQVKHVGQYGPHAAAKKAGFQQGDVLVEFAGRNDLLTDSALLAYGVTHHLPGETVKVVVLRDGERVSLTLPMQP